MTTEAKLVLFQLTGDNDNDVRHAATNAIRNIELTQKDADLIKNRAYTLSTAQANHSITKISKLRSAENEDFIIQFASHESWTVRRSVATALGKTKSGEQAIRTLKMLKNDSDSDVRNAAQRALNN